MNDDRALGVTISLYNSQINKIREHVKNSKKYKTEAAFFQHIVDDYFNREKKNIIKNFILYLIYPIVLSSLMLYVAITTDGINKLLAGQGYFVVELAYVANNFYLIGFGCLSLLFVSMYLLIYKLRGK